MESLYKLEEIVQMKLLLVKVLLEEIEIGTRKGYHKHVNACKTELETIKYQIIHPETILKI